jgi:hypothetical protein
MRNLVLSLYDFTGGAVRPWVNAGFGAVCFDIQHDGVECIHNKDNEGFIVKADLDLYDPQSLQDIADNYKGRVAMILGFPPCTDLAVSGAKWFESKRAKDPAFQTKAAGHCMAIADLAAKLDCPFMVENPVSVLSTLWRKPNHTFHPYEYGGYIQDHEAIHPQWPDHIAPRDAYSKKTCIWSGGGFVMPAPLPVSCESFGASRQHQRLGGKSLKTKNIRSATPRGFAQAVYEANEPNAIAANAMWLEYNQAAE